MTKFAFKTSLNDAARHAFDLGDGKHGSFAVNGKHIAKFDSNGRAMDWILVIDGSGEPIAGIDENPTASEAT